MTMRPWTFAEALRRLLAGSGLDVDFEVMGKPVELALLGACKIVEIVR